LQKKVSSHQLLRHLLKKFYRLVEREDTNHLEFKPILGGMVLLLILKIHFMKGYLLDARLFAQKLLLIVASALLATITFAQDKKEIDVNINNNKSNFWGQPWVWVVGAAIFILLLVAILRGGRKNA
jgi:hypothetical protein